MLLENSCNGDKISLIDAVNFSLIVFKVSSFKANFGFFSAFSPRTVEHFYK